MQKEKPNVYSDEIGGSKFSEPELNIRLHHLDLKDFQDVLIREIDPTSAAQSRVARMMIMRSIALVSNNHEYEPYHKDIFGEDDATAQITLEKWTDFYTKLFESSDDTTVEISESPDDMCRGCTIGRHCAADNYKSNGETHSPLNSQETLASRLLSSFAGSGFQEDVDFIVRDKIAVFEDVDTGNLDSPEGVLEKRDITSITTTMRVLRATLSAQSIQN